MAYVRIIIATPMLFLGLYRLVMMQFSLSDIFNSIVTLVLLVLGYLVAAKGIKELRARKK
ncbi:MAG TPA: hypothetical protein PKV15_06990 [Syntrophomonadaceae bacterium]|jgi:positive regulator of sigma E activity|nr:hypothetical protein [Syntrophomonadaceae bacterium]HRX21306.1 hypothetical protein [Syntrophomonadaceae bacterium]